METNERTIKDISSAMNNARDYRSKNLSALANLWQLYAIDLALLLLRKVGRALYRQPEGNYLGRSDTSGI